MIDDDVRRAIELGERNQEALTLASNWCAHLQVESWGGIGLLEQSTGLPIGSRYFRCKYAIDDGYRYTELHDAALHFYDQNCEGCGERQPVRLPNLIALVERRDAERTRRKRARDEAQKKAQLALAQRDSRRQRLRAEVGPTTAGLIDLIGEFDENPTPENGKRLVGAATASPDHFLGPVVDLLYDLLAAGDEVHAESALLVLDRVETDRPRLSRAALLAVAEGVAVTVAAGLGTRDLGEASSDDVSAALPGLIHLAGCERPWPSATNSDPGPLRRVAVRHPQLVEQKLAELLRSGSPEDRRTACQSINQLGSAGSNLRLGLIDPLVRAVLAPDREYGEYGRAAATLTLGTALREHPERVNSALEAASAKGTSEDRRHLFAVVVRSIRSQSGGRDDAALSDARDVALRRVIAVLARPDDHRMVREAVDLLELIARDWPGAIVPHADSLLGCAALMATALDAPEETLVEPAGLEPLAALTGMGKRTALGGALRRIIDVVSATGARFPHAVGAQLCEVLQQEDVEAERLRAAIVEGLGKLCRTPGGLSLGLPYLYRGLVHSSQLIRSSAATAYGNVLQSHGDDLPDLVHETFLPLLQDPYVIVHDSALRINYRKMPSRFKRHLLVSVAQLVNNYASSGERDQILAVAIQQLLRLTREFDPSDHRTIQKVIHLLSEMDPHEAFEVVEAFAFGGILRGENGYAELIVSLIMDPQTWSHRVPALVEELEELSRPEICSIKEALPAAATQARARLIGEFNLPEPTVSILDVLVRADAWEEATVVARDRLDEVGQDRWEAGRRLHAEAFVVAIELERALSGGDVDPAVDRIKRWRGIGQEMEVFNEARKERLDRIPFDL